MPVGHIWKFDLEQRKKNDFGVKCNFSKIRNEHVMLKFLAATKNIRKIGSEEPNYNCGKVVEKTAGNCYSQFPDINLYESRAVSFLTEDRVIASGEESESVLDQSEPLVERWKTEVSQCSSPKTHFSN